MFSKEREPDGHAIQFYSKLILKLSLEKKFPSATNENCGQYIHNPFES
jgi:hypothetical protein